ncbi:Furin-1 [Thelohanellus kitauei]|uniref:Furin-1 n=1 Tax=Thelohanellus kitauei TaxID=669202 RepID=A0A0C2MLS7_THEKT|nr:Furin-1 [Thelohanellus kitauei]
MILCTVNRRFTLVDETKTFPLLWDRRINGMGVVISVFDGGIDTTQPELKDSYDPMLIYNFVEKITDQHTGTHHHGTKCAGLIVGKANNERCGVGAAYGARIGAVRLYGGSTFTAQYPKNMNTFIFIAIAGTVGRPLTQTAENVERLGRYGRNGKGTVFLWTTGNEGPNDHCGYNWYVQRKEVFALSAVTKTGGKQAYGERCTGALASCIGGNSGTPTSKLFTTLPNAQCSKSFTGTSACPPIVSAAIACLLQVIWKSDSETSYGYYYSVISTN